MQESTREGGHRSVEYEGFEIRKHRPCKKTYYRIYKDDKFKQTSSRLKDAKRSIDFNLKHKVWS